MNFNAFVASFIEDGYIVCTQIGVSGLLKTTEKLSVGQSINVDISSNKTVEFKKNFCGPEFNLVQEYNAFWTKSWIYDYTILEFDDLNKDIFTVKSSDDGKEHHIHKNFVQEFHSAGNIVEYKDFIESIKLGVTKWEVEITFMYSFPCQPYEASVIKIWTISSELSDDLK